jgi:hypothetical protein
MNYAGYSGMKSGWRLALLALAAAALAGIPSVSYAQTYPEKPIRWIVPFPPGGSTDILARVVGQKLTEAWGQPVVIENKGGAGGTIGATEAARATPNGYTLLMGAIHHTIASSVYPSLPYDFQRDLAPVTVVAIVPNVLVVNPSVPAKTVPKADRYAANEADPWLRRWGTAHHPTQSSIRNGVDIVTCHTKAARRPLQILSAGRCRRCTTRLLRPAAHQGRAAAARRGDREARRLLPDVPRLPMPRCRALRCVVRRAGPGQDPEGNRHKLNGEIVRI